MKKLIPFLLLLCASLAGAQIDIQIPSVGPVKDVIRNANWAGSGRGNVNNSYVFTPSNLAEGVCFYFANNDTNTHTFVMNVVGTGDQNVKTYQGNTAAWTNLGPTSPIGLAGVGPSLTIAAFVQIQNAANVALVITSASGTGTVSITMVEGATASGCNNTITTAPLVCPISVTTTVLTGTTAQLVAPQANKAVYLCSVTFSFAAAPSVASVSIVAGTGPTCGTGTQTLFTFSTAATDPLVNHFIGGAGGLTGRYSYSAGSAVDNLGSGNCVANNSTGTLTVSASEAQF